MKQPTGLLLLTAFFCCGGVSAEIFPRWPVDLMCDMADVVLEGTAVGADIVQVERVYKGDALLTRQAGKVVVARLDRHDRALWNGRRDERGDAIQTRKLVLFLARDRDAGTWESLETIDSGSACGSCGLLWFDDTTCYGYRQAMNPGPYVLMSAMDGPLLIPNDAEALRADIAQGIASAATWRVALAIAEPREKAKALSKYLVRRTDPTGDLRTFRFHVRESMRVLGKDAVPALVDIIEHSQPDDELDETVLILHDIGPEARLAVPHLCRLLSSPRQTHTVYVLNALRSIRDRSAIPQVRPVLRNTDFDVAVAAAETLSALKAQVAFPEIAALIPEQPRREDKYRVCALLNALYALDPERAAPIVKRIASTDHMVDIRKQIQGMDE